VSRGYRQTTMASIAAAAGVTKRTLYLWHEDKAALFRACLAAGTARFPTIDPTALAVAAELERYLIALVSELSAEHSNAMGRLFLRESGDFPELAPMVQRSYSESIIDPLATFLRAKGLEQPASLDRTELLAAMALAPVHNSLLLGRPMPDRATVEAHVDLVVGVFLNASDLGAESGPA
jgi:AcrR family transcriptional regulator